MTDYSVFALARSIAQERTQTKAPHFMSDGSSSLSHRCATSVYDAIRRMFRGNPQGVSIEPAVGTME